MTTIPASGAAAAAQPQFRRDQFPGDFKPIDLKHFSAVSAASDFAFKAADTDRDAALSIEEFAALGKKDPADSNTRALFAAIDGDEDGKLNATEIRSSGLLSPSNIQALLGVEDVGAWIVAQADTDGDGGLSYAEYTETRDAGPIKARMPGPDGEMIEVEGRRLDVAPRIFERMDSDGDGILSAAELGAHMQPGEGSAPYHPMAGAQRTAPSLVTLNDADGDGGLSADELAQAASAAGAEDADLSALMAAADSDADGKISADEFATMVRETRPQFGLARPHDEAGPSASALTLSQLLRSTYAQLSESFVAAAPKTDFTA